MPPNVLLLQPRQKVLYAAMLAALRGQHTGQSLQELWPAWRDATGLSPSSLEALLHGSYESAVAKAAYDAMAAETNESPVTRIAPRMGRIPRLTCEVMLEIRTSAARGSSIDELARRHQTTPLIVRRIVDGEYHTSAMRQALALDQMRPVPEFRI